MAAFSTLLAVTEGVRAKPVPQRYVDDLGQGPMTVGEVEGTMPPPAKAMAGDTTWVADWTFDAPNGSCTAAGWTTIDYRILNDGSNFWSVNTNFAGIGGIVNKAAVLRKHDLAWIRDGYGSDWDYSIILAYRGASTLTFSFLSDGEPCCDFVHVETDSGGASEALVNYAHPNEMKDAATYRDEIFLTSGLHNVTTEGPLALSDYGVPGTTQEVYIRFTSDGGWDDADGDYLSFWKAGLVVDNIVVDGAPSGAGGYDYSENFEGALNANVTLANTAPAKPYGQWARVFEHATDNDKCQEDLTCQWIFTDPTRAALFPSMAFGPGGTITPNWADNIVVSPWVSLAGTLGASYTTLTFRDFGAQIYTNGRIRGSWSVRARVRRDNTDTAAPGDSVLLYGPWVHQAEWYGLGFFNWATAIGDLTPYLAGATEMQVRFRTADWQYVEGVSPPTTLNPGPGQYIDRVRIARQILAGPVLDPGIDTREQANDAFPTVKNSMTGDHYSPAVGNIFGTCAFSMGDDSGCCWCCPSPPYPYVSADSITIQEVLDVRGAGGVTDVKFYGAIVSGPHAGKCPPPYTIGSNGFFHVTPDSGRTRGSCALVSGRFSLDLSVSHGPAPACAVTSNAAQDNYFRGGDVLKYFWTATDALGGRASFPAGLSASNWPPASVEAAEAATSGLVEVDYLPVIDWDPAYLAAVQADDFGDVAPTAAQIANSSQRNCILYYNGFNTNRRSTDVNRTAFMYTLDRLGYRGHYDVYDQQGGGNSNNQLGSRADITQAVHYALIIQDLNRGGVIPDGTSNEDQRVDMHEWYTQWLDDGANAAGPGIHTLWMIGDDTAFELAAQGSALLTSYLGLAGGAQTHNDQGLSTNPNVDGVASFTFTNGNTASFGADLFSLNGGCPAIRDYDGSAATSGGSAVATHKYVSGATTGDNAIVMNKNTTLKWNAIWQGFSWFDIRQAFNTSPQANTPDVALMRTILDAALPQGCHRTENPTDVPAPETEAVPPVSMLHQNAPNPFNPTTAIEFDLSHDGHVRLLVFDVAGHRVTTLVDGVMERGYRKKVIWNGLDESGRRVPSGVYLYRLVADDLTATRKMVMLQ